MGLIESALARPGNLASYSESDAFELAAQSGYDIAGNHGFIDGNKRTAYVVTRLFLILNGFDLTAKATERVLVFETLSRGGLRPDEFAEWLRRHGDNVENR
jgi:death-on-curing protein